MVEGAEAISGTNLATLPDGQDGCRLKPAGDLPQNAISDARGLQRRPGAAVGARLAYCVPRIEPRACHKMTGGGTTLQAKRLMVRAALEAKETLTVWPVLFWVLARLNCGPATLWGLR